MAALIGAARVSGDQGRGPVRQIDKTLAIAAVAIAAAGSGAALASTDAFADKPAAAGASSQASPPAGGQDNGEGNSGQNHGQSNGSAGNTPGSGSGSDGGSGSSSSSNGTADGTTGNPQPGGAATLPAAASPVAGRSVSLAPAGGSVTVTLPGSTTPIALANLASVPVGSVIDATRGAVTLTSVKDSAGVTQTGRFWGGAFRVAQGATPNARTVLTVVDRGIGKCAAPAHARSAAHVSAASRRRVSRLWGSDNHGAFTTRGSNAIASVRGTVWLTEDSCAGTLVRVKQGVVAVRDIGRRATVLVSAGHTYAAWRR